MRTFRFFAIAFAFVAPFAALSVAAGAAATVAVNAPWSRPATGTGAVYLTIKNLTSTPDRLVAASSPVAQHVELHETVQTKGSMGSMGSMSGMSMGVASMHPVAYIAVPANGTATLAPGGYHIMLIGLRHDLHANQTFPIRLHFAHAGWVAATVHVRAM